jgi:HPt (histidine-containing phosphotransfer) domain-containing protein
LPTAAGLDTADGLSRVGGNHALYLKLLRQFIDQHGSAAGEIGDALARGDAAAAERLAHAVKGVAGNIGATHVRSAAGALEKLIRGRASSKDVETAADQFAARLERLIMELRAVLKQIPAPPDRATPTAPIDPAQSRQAAAQLTKLLAELDPGAADFLEANHAALRPLFAGAVWPEFEALVQGYAFADAQARLEQAMQSLPSQALSSAGSN